MHTAFTFVQHMRLQNIIIPSADVHTHRAPRNGGQKLDTCMVAAMREYWGLPIGQDLRYTCHEAHPLDEIQCSTFPYCRGAGPVIGPAACANVSAMGDVQHKHVDDLFMGSSRSSQHSMQKTEMFVSCGSFLVVVYP